MKNDSWYWMYPNYRPLYWFNWHECCRGFRAQMDGLGLSIVNGHLYISDEGEVDPFETNDYITKDHWSDIITSLGRDTLAFVDGDTVDDNILNALVRLEPRYRLWYGASLAERAYEEEGYKAINRALGFAFEDLMNRCEIAYERWVPILKMYSDTEANLLAQIKTTSTASSRFNDTPQNGGSWEDDSHTTNITQMTSNSATDGDTPIRRLEEVRRLWASIMTEMVDYLAEMLIPEANI